MTKLQLVIQEIRDAIDAIADPLLFPAQPLRLARDILEDVDRDTDTDNTHDYEIYLDWQGRPRAHGCARCGGSRLNPVHYT